MNILHVHYSRKSNVQVRMNSSLALASFPHCSNDLVGMRLFLLSFDVTSNRERERKAKRIDDDDEQRRERREEKKKKEDRYFGI